MAPPRCVIDPAATTNRANRVYNRHSARGGDDDPRRGNSLPREGLQLCVAPYFADGCRRHAGTVEVHRENATPEAVAGCHRTTLLRDPPLIHSTLYWVRQPRTPPGCDLGGTQPRPPRMSPRPRVAKYGATHSCNPSRGGELPRLWSSSADSGVAAMASQTRTTIPFAWGLHYWLLQKLCPAPLGAGH